MTSEQFKQARLLLGLSQADFGALIGLSRSSVYNIEQGHWQVQDVPIHKIELLIEQKMLEMQAFSTRRKNAITALKAAQEMGDIEQAHVWADEVLVEFLEALGYEDVVTEYKKVEKWYA